MGKYIFITNGKGRCGKDTLYQIVANNFNNVAPKYSSIDWIKEIASKYFGYEGHKTDKDRKMLCELKRIATEYDDLPFKNCIEHIYEFAESEYDMLFIDIREPNEITKICRFLDDNFPDITLITLLIKREICDGFIYSNKADSQVYEFDYDYIIHNDSSIEDFEKEVIKLFKTF